MQHEEKSERRNAVPIIYVRGTHYEVGRDVGRTFSGLIQSFLNANRSLNTTLLKIYETVEGKQVFDAALEAAKKSFPQYVRELEGIADGASVPFYKLLLLHMEEILTNVLGVKIAHYNDNGCSDICCNEPGQEIIGHTEDAVPEMLGRCYLVSAHIICNEPQGRWKVKEEHFTSFCYPGYLPGYTMGYNHHGFVYTINSIRPQKLGIGKIPGTFLTRALLAAENLEQVQNILRDKGCGSAEGFSVNMTFLNQEGDRLFHNAEVGPTVDGATESPLNIFTTSPGECLIHCNKYLRLNVPEVSVTLTSSHHRHATINTFPKPVSKKDVIKILGDQSDKDYSIYRETESVQTVSIGIFDCIQKTWSIYTDNPKKNEPIVVLPLLLKEDKSTV